jgi:hypothetical protein
MSEFVAVTFQFEGDTEFELAFFLPIEEWEYSRQQLIEDEEGMFPLRIDFANFTSEYEDATELFDMANLVVTKLTEQEYNSFGKVFPNFKVGPADVEIPYMTV